MLDNLTHLADFLRRIYHTHGTKKPFIIGITGCVAVGKTVLSDALKQELEKYGICANTVCTDSFILSNHELAQRGLESRKGFPESYDTPAMHQFIETIRSDKPAAVSIYDHIIYDIVSDKTHIINPTDILIIEGLNILNFKQACPEKNLFDITIYIQAEESDNKKWFLERVRTLRHQANKNPVSFYRQFSHLPEIIFIAGALRVWHTVNKKNFYENIRPFKQHADIIVRKNRDHAIESIRENAGRNHCNNPANG